MRKIINFINSLIDFNVLIIILIIIGICYGIQAYELHISEVIINDIICGPDYGVPICGTSKFSSADLSKKISNKSNKSNKVIE